jgi:hypothetical protein
MFDLASFPSSFSIAMRNYEAGAPGCLFLYRLLLKPQGAAQKILVRSELSEQVIFSVSFPAKPLRRFKSGLQIHWGFELGKWVAVKITKR